MDVSPQHPGYLGAQDEYYVGNIKGVGHIYQQTLILLSDEGEMFLSKPKERPLQAETLSLGCPN
jgi:hypothetical protein